MKQRLTAILTSAAALLFALTPMAECLPAAAETYTIDWNPEAEEIVSEAHYLVPENAMKSAVEVDPSGRLQLWERKKTRAQHFERHEMDGYCYFLDPQTGLVITADAEVIVAETPTEAPERSEEVLSDDAGAVQDGGEVETLPEQNEVLIEEEEDESPQETEPVCRVKKGAQLYLSAYEEADTQLWRMEAAGNGYILRLKADENYVMDNYYATDRNGAQIVADTYNGGANQRFDFVTDLLSYDEDEGYAIVPEHAGGSALELNADKHLVQLNTADRTSNQTWSVHPAGEYYYIENMSNKQVLQTNNGKAEKGQQLAAGKYTGADNQLWKLEPADDGTFFIRSKQDNNLVVDVSGGSRDNGTAIKAWSYNGGKAQRFRFVHTTTPEPVNEWGASLSDCSGTDWAEWDGSYNTTWYTSDKTKKAYDINTAEELAGIAQLVKNGTTDFAGVTLHLRRDINLNSIAWQDIGTKEDHPFRGSFNGHDHAIIGLFIENSYSEDGFFGAVDGGTICDLAIQGSVKGKKNIGGVCGILKGGHIINVYSEVAVSEVTDENIGGIVGRISRGGYVEHCTQNAKVSTTDSDCDRGGIAGYVEGGIIRWCVNKATLSLNCKYVGGMCGTCRDGKVEYCANYGKIDGGKSLNQAGGICGRTCDNAIVFACYNEGNITSQGDDYIGGIVGNRCDSSHIYCCINAGTIKGDDRIGGIVGDSDCQYCLNAGVVSGDDNVGAITGDTGNSLKWCRALSWTSASRNGKGDAKNANGAEWVNADQLISGEVCCQLNGGGNGILFSDYGLTDQTVFYQNIGGDPLPTFAGEEVTKSGNSYVNSEYAVRVEFDRDRGTVLGGGFYQNGKVTIMAAPAFGYSFDHMDIITAATKNQNMYNGAHPAPDAKVTTYKTPTADITEDIQSSYTVKVYFKSDDPLENALNYDGTPNSTVGKFDKDGVFQPISSYTDINKAWEAANKLGKEAVIRLDSPWIMDSSLYTYENSTLTIDLNGYAIVRTSKGMQKNATAIHLLQSTLTIIDSNPDRKTNPSFNGGSIQGGRNKGESGLIYVDYASTLHMTGGTLYNGGAYKGGAIANYGTTVLNGVNIANCWADGWGKTCYGGAIYSEGTLTLRNCTIKSCRSYDYAGAVSVNQKSTATLENVDIISCSVNDDKGGAIGIFDGSTLQYRGGSVKNCIAKDSDAGAIMQEKGTLQCQDVVFEGNQAHECGGAIYVNSKSSTWLIRCDFRKNTCDDDGAAIYFDSNNNYMDGCTVTNNAAKDQGAIKVEDDSSLDVCGKMIIKNNDGTGTMDNLIFESGGYLYNCGLTNGSEVHLRSTKAGTVRLANDDYAPISEYAMQHYLVADCGTLELRDQKERTTRLQASVFTEDRTALYIGGAVVILALTCGLVYMRKRRKGEKA